MPAELVTVASFRDVLDAEAAKAALESAGIECYLANSEIVGMNWMWSQAVGGVKLRVWDHDLEDARQLLSENRSTDAEEAAAAAEPEEHCPRCGSTELHLVNLSRLPAAVSAFITLPIPIFGRRVKCSACGHRWKGAVR